MSKALATKNVAAVLLSVAMLLGVTFAFATPAQAQTLESLQAQIQLLLAQIAALQGGGSQQAGGLACTVFTRNHSQGDTGGEVMALQKFLNSVDGTQIATTGAGSPGNETSYFGGLTKAAVVKFQDKFAADVLTPVGLSKGTGYWGASSRAKANALCASAPPPGTTPPPVTGGNLIIGAGAQPANSLAPGGAARVPFTTFTLTNTTGAAVTVSGVTVERTGLASDTNFSSVVLLDESGNQVGISRVLNSNHQAVIGDTVTINAGQTRTFTVAANMAATPSAGQIASFAVIGINTTATVSGSLPITGAAHTTNASLTIGTATMANGSLNPAADDSSEEVGSQDKVFTALRITAGSAEEIRVNSIRWNQSGSASASDLSGVEVLVDGTAYPATVSSDGKYYTASFGSGIVVAKGLSKEFTVRADIVGGAGRTVAFDIYKATDVNVTGQTFGYGITPNDGDTGTETAAEGTWTDGTSPVYDGYDVTIAAGSISSVSRSDVVATGNIAESVAGTPLGSFAITVIGEPISVSTVKFGLQLTGGDDGDDITNITLVDQNGVVLGGPVDGSATDYTPTGGSANEGSASFSSVTFPVGTTIVTIKGQLGTDFSATDTVQIQVNPTDWTGATGQVTGNNISFSSALSTGNTQTVQAAALSATTLPNPIATNIVAGTVDFTFMTGLLDAANSGEDIRVTAIEVEDAEALSTSGDVNFVDNVEIWADITSSMSSRGDKYETKVSNTTQLTASSTNITLTTPIEVAKNTTVEFAVIGDLNSSALNTSTFTFDIGDSTGATGVGKTTGTAASDAIPTGSGQKMTVSSGGTLTVTEDSSSPTIAVQQIYLDNTTSEQTLAVFKFASNNVENIEIDTIALGQNGTTNNESVSMYKLYKGSATTPFRTVSNDGQATTTITLASGELVIPKNDNVKVTVKAVMNDIDGTVVVNGNTVIVQLGSTTATGLASQSTSLGDDEAYKTIGGVIYEAYPSIAFDSSTTGIGSAITGNSSQLVARLNVTNPGNKDVTFEGADSDQISVQLVVIGDDTDTATEALTLKDENGTVLASTTFSSASGTTQEDFDFKGTGTNLTYTIPAGATKTLYIYADTADLEDNGDLIQITLDDAAADVTFGISNTGAFTEGDIIFRGDPAGPVLRYTTT